MNINASNLLNQSLDIYDIIVSIYKIKLFLTNAICLELILVLKFPFRELRSRIYY